MSPELSALQFRPVIVVAAAKIATACGIHSGEVISGLMGSQEERDFTIIGDTVNMSARCFAIAEKLGENGCVVSSEATAAGAAEICAGLSSEPLRLKAKNFR